MRVWSYMHQRARDFGPLLQPTHCAIEVDAYATHASLRSVVERVAVDRVNCYPCVVIQKYVVIAIVDKYSGSKED